MSCQRSRKSFVPIVTRKILFRFVHCYHLRGRENLYTHPRTSSYFDPTLFSFPLLLTRIHTSPSQQFSLSLFFAFLFPRHIQSVLNCTTSFPRPKSHPNLAQCHGDDKSRTTESAAIGWGWCGWNKPSHCTGAASAFTGRLVSLTNMTISSSPLPAGTMG